MMTSTLIATASLRYALKDTLHQRSMTFQPCVFNFLLVGTQQSFDTEAPLLQLVARLPILEQLLMLDWIRT